MTIHIRRRRHPLLSYHVARTIQNAVMAESIPQIQSDGHLSALKSSTLLLTTVLILSIAGLLFLAPRARRSLGAHRIPLETGLLIPSGPTPIDPREADVDNQVAAPAETGTPNLHRAIIAHKECGWKDGVRGDWAERQRLPLGKTQIILTVTGLLMEGVDFIELEGNGVIRAINTVSVIHSRLTCRNL